MLKSTSQTQISWSRVSRIQLCARARARGGSYEDETDEGPRLERAEVMVS